MSLIFYQTLFTTFDGGVHVAHLLPDSVHLVWRCSSCRSSFTRLCSSRLTVEFMSLIFYQTLFIPFDGGVHVAHLLPDSVHPVWRWSSCRSSSQFSVLCVLIYMSSQFSVLSVGLWVLPFPLEDCSVFGNFAIIRIRSLPFFQCFPCLWTVPFCFPKLLIAHSIFSNVYFWHDIIYNCIASKALKGKFTFIFLFLYVCSYR